VDCLNPPILSDREAWPSTDGIEKMLRMYLLQSWFNLSDEGVEDAI
jgi:IS5 family transposase